MVQPHAPETVGRGGSSPTRSGGGPPGSSTNRRSAVESRGMPYRFLADALVVFHLAFVTFVIFGGLLVVRWPRVAFAHLPAAAWGVFIEWSGLICPLTPLENRLRELGHEATYQGGFINHYIMPVLYPDGLTREIQFVLGAGILILNVTLYVITVRRLRRVRRTSLSAPVREPDQPVHQPRS
jgi:hypothetical protein